MQKAIILVLFLIGNIVAAMVFFLFNPLSLFYYIAGSSCASVGITHLSEHDIKRHEEDPYYKDIMILGDNELRELPKMPDLIKKVSSKVEFNQDSRLTVSYDEMEQYYRFFEEKYEQQLGFKPKEKQYSFLIEHDGKKYLIIDFVFNYPEQDRDLVVIKDPTIAAPKIALTTNDLDKIPRIKNAISEIGTYKVSTHESVGVSEDDLDRYGEWFFKQYEKQYGNATQKPHTYFKYKDELYMASFAIC